ncbi:MAG: hypothetical protein JAZ17_25145 [Candidatus Thiodiazotropha endolucinida]|nr:hypothetical protein [Candidatus Thiodiazotropha endolucinida]
MKKVEVEIYSDASNISVIRHPGRNYPGSLIQGDTLLSLIQMAKEIKDEIESNNLNDAKEELDELILQLEERLDHYEYVLKEHGIDLPYVRNT